MLEARNDPPPLEGGGSGRSLPLPLLATAAACSVFATVLSVYSIVLQLRAYYQPTLQRYTVRILVMVPIYAVASLTSLFSLSSAFVVDVLRDLYEALTVLSLFNLMIAYLGGERSIIVLAHDRKPVPHPWPVRLFYRPLDVSNPHTFLALKRGVLQYVQIKPILAIGTIATKLTGTYHDGKLGLNYYTFEQIIYNFSVFLSLYCLAMFWSCLSPDLAAFRVTPKFLCIKGIIFFEFWQSLGISIIVALGLVTRIGPVADPQYLSIAITDVLICLEMPFFAIGHLYAFSPRDYIDKSSYYQARLPAKYALRDAIGIYDMMADAIDTIKGGMRQRYSGLSSPSGVGDKTADGSSRMKYTDGHRHARSKTRNETQSMSSRTWAFLRAPISSIGSWYRKRRMEGEGYSPLLQEEAADSPTQQNTDLESQRGRTEVGDTSLKHDDLYEDTDDEDESDDDELAVKLRGLAKEGVVGMLDFLTGQKFRNSHEDDASVVSCHFSLHEGQAESSDGSSTPPLDDTEVLYEEARELAREGESNVFPGTRTGEQEESLRRWIVEQEAALRAVAPSQDDNEAKRARRSRPAKAAAAAVAAGGAVLPWVKKRRQREDELIGRMRMLREKRMTRRETRRRERLERRGGSSSASASAPAASADGSAAAAGAAASLVEGADGATTSKHDGHEGTSRDRKGKEKRRNRRLHENGRGTPEDGTSLPGSR